MTSSAAEPADLLQRRLAVFARVMFVAFVILRIAEFVLYRAVREIWPNHYWTIFTIGVTSVVLLATTWQVLRRIELPRPILHVVDMLLMGGCGAVFGATAMLAWNRHESAYTCLVYACFVVFMRAIVVPSSGWRTMAVSALAMVPMLIAALQLAVTTTQDVPGPAFFAGAAIYTSTAVAVAATGSRVIYGLRRRVTALELELGQYTLVRQLGEGPTGAVFVARHALLRRPTAIKLVQPSAIGIDVMARCERAVQEMSHLRHPSSIAVYDYGRSPEGQLYLAMEYLEGISLDVLHARYGAQPPGRAVAIAIQVCGALNEAHQRGFTHGNLKASNVFLCERGGLCDVAKLTDFGFARADATPTDDLRTLGAIVASSIGETEVASIAACFANATSAKQLARLLRSLGDLGWTPTTASAWWADYRRTSAPFLQVPTTLAVDLGRRAITAGSSAR